MRDAFLDLAAQFACTPREAKHAWKQALHAQQQKEAADAAQQRQLLQNAPGNGITVLLAAHPYLAHDPYMGGALSDMLANMGVTLLYADCYDRKRALQSSFQFSDTLPWIVNRDIVGSIMNLHDSVDGILLVSAFPLRPRFHDRRRYHPLHQGKARAQPYGRCSNRYRRPRNAHRKLHRHPSLPETRWVRPCSKLTTTTLLLKTSKRKIAPLDPLLPQVKSLPKAPEAHAWP